MPPHLTPPQPQPTLTWQYILYEVRGTLTCPPTPHPTPTPTHTRDLSSVATRNVVKDPEILATWQYIMYEVQGTLTCPPTPPHPNPKTKSNTQKRSKTHVRFSCRRHIHHLHQIHLQLQVLNVYILAWRSTTFSLELFCPSLGN